MNWEQISSILRHILTFGGGFVVGKGWISETVMLELVGAALTVGGAIWAMFNKTQASIVASAAAQPDVKSITLEPSASASLVKDSPSNVSK
jgi:hypothetical protein